MESALRGVMTALTPKGVEHRVYGFEFGRVVEVMTALTPKGVEHLRSPTIYRLSME